MEVWQARSLTTETASYATPEKPAAEPGLYCYALKTAAPAGDGRAYYSHRTEHDPGGQPSEACQGSAPQEAGQYDYPPAEAFPSLPGIVPPWYYYASTSALPKRSLYPGAPRLAEAGAAGAGTATEAGRTAAAVGRTAAAPAAAAPSAAPPGATAPPVAAAAAAVVAAAAAAAAAPSGPFVNGSWVGAPGPRRSRRRYQLWRESRQFLDSYYYDRRGRGATLQPRPQLPPTQPPPPPLLPLLDLPDGGASGGASKAPPPLLPLSEAAGGHPPPHHLYPHQATDARPPPDLLPMGETPLGSQPPSKVKAHLPRHFQSLPEVSQAGLARHSLLCQHRHDLQPGSAHPYHHYLHYHLQLSGSGGDPRSSVRYPHPPCPHRPPQVSHPSVHLPPLSSAEVRDRHARAAFLRDLYHPQ